MFHYSLRVIDEPNNNLCRLWVDIYGKPLLIPSTDEIRLTLTLKMTTAQVVETSVAVNSNSPIQDYVQQDDH